MTYVNNMGIHRTNVNDESIVELEAMVAPHLGVPSASGGHGHTRHGHPPGSPLYRYSRFVYELTNGTVELNIDRPSLGALHERSRGITPSLNEDPLCRTPFMADLHTTGSLPFWWGTCLRNTYVDARAVGPTIIKRSNVAPAELYTALSVGTIRPAQAELGFLSGGETGDVDQARAGVLAILAQRSLWLLNEKCIWDSTLRRWPQSDPVGPITIIGGVRDAIELAQNLGPNELKKLYERVRNHVLNDEKGRDPIFNAILRT